jgi:hypothetical protein
MNATRKFTLTVARLEDGSTGEDVAYTTQMPVLLGMLTLAIMVAMIGFWRMGAFMGSENGAFKAATSSGDGVTNGRDAAIGIFRDWSTDQNVTDSVVTVQRDGDSRSSSAAINFNKNVNWGTGASTDFAVTASSAKRWERFYGGPPKCDGTTCKE